MQYPNKYSMLPESFPGNDVCHAICTEQESTPEYFHAGSAACNKP